MKPKKCFMHTYNGGVLNECPQVATMVLDVPPAAKLYLCGTHATDMLTFMPAVPLRAIGPDDSSV